MKAAANAQRSRIAFRTFHDALITTVNHQWSQNGPYVFSAEDEGGFTDIRFAARLPDSFPGVGRFGGSIVRQVRFAVEGGEGGKNQLVMYQKPLLLPKETGDFNPYRLVLSPDISLFEVKFFDERTGKTEPKWIATNSLPRLVEVTIGMGRKKGSDTPLDLTHTYIAIPANPVTPDLQGLSQGPGVPGGVR